MESPGSTSDAVTSQCGPGKDNAREHGEYQRERRTNNLEGPAAIVGRAAKSLSMAEAERLASMVG